MSRSYMPGATTVGIVCRDGVVLASEKRIAYGMIVLSKAGKKVFKVADHIGLACAGLFSDMQAISRILSAELELLSLDTGRKVSVRGAAKYLANILFGRRYYPYYAETIVAGVDESGPKLFILDPIGSLLEDKYSCLGTGMQVAIGIVEAEYKDGLSLKEGKALALKAMRAALQRDAASGDGIDLILITDGGFTEEYEPVKASAY